MKAGEVVTAKHIEAMLKAQGLAKRGILPGDVVYVYTGWGDYWRDPDTEKFYYAKAPGLSYDAAKYLGERRVVAIGLDTPFVDPVPEECSPQGRGRRRACRRDCLSRCTTTLLTQMGIHLSRTRNSTNWRATRCGPPAPWSCRCSKRAAPVRRSGRCRSGSLQGNSATGEKNRVRARFHFPEEIGP